MRNLLIFVMSLIFVQISNAQIDTITVVYTHNTNGVLENCNCPVRSYGALEKRAALIDSIRHTNPKILLLDTGDILDIQKSTLLHQYVLMAYDYMKYDFWTPGDQDFVEGTSFFLNKLMRLSAQMVTSNIRYRESAIGQTFAIKKIGNIRVGITGTTREDLHKFLDLPAERDFQFENQLSALGQVVHELSGKSDFLIVLSHSGIERDREIAKLYPEINLIIGGHSQTILSQPEKIAKTYITQVGESGYRTGIFTIIFQNKKILTTESKVVLLKKEMADNPAIVNMINHYHQERLAK